MNKFEQHILEYAKNSSKLIVDFDIKAVKGNIMENSLYYSEAFINLYRNEYIDLINKNILKDSYNISKDLFVEYSITEKGINYLNQKSNL